MKDSFITFFDGQIRIAWYGIEPLTFAKDEALVTLLMQVKTDIKWK